MRVRLDQSGRIVIPKPLRDQLGVVKGDRFILSWEHGRISIHSPRDKKAALRRLIGIINDSNMDPNAEPLDPLDLKKIWDPWY